MSGDFTYVWDAELHGVPETLEQANEMFEHFHAVAREHRKFEQLPKINTYAGALERYYEQHDLDRHNQPEFEHIDRGVLIIEEGLIFGSPQHYHAVQLAVAQGLVFFEVDANIVFLPDGRVLPESQQFAWQQHGLRLAQEASKPADQVFPRTEKDFDKRLYRALEGFITKHGFSRREHFYIFKQMLSGELMGRARFLINSLGVMIEITFTKGFIPLQDDFYIRKYYKKNPYVIIVSIIDFLGEEVKKYSNIDIYPQAHRVKIKNNDVEALSCLIGILPSRYEHYYYKLQDMAWANQLVNHNNFHFGAVISHPQALPCM